MLVTDRTFSADCERVARADEVTVDLETNGLAPWKGDRLVGVAVRAGGESRYFPVRHGGGGNLPDGSLEKLLGALRGKHVYKNWFLRFDLTTLSYERGGDWCLASGLPTRDGVVDALLLDENQPSYTLEAAAERALGLGAGQSKRTMDDLLRERFPKVKAAGARKGMLWKLPAADVAGYACGDVDLAEAIDDELRTGIERQGLGALSAELNAYQMLLARMQVAGVPVDVERCRRLSEGTGARQAAVLAQLRAEAGPTFNPGSWQQVSRLLETKDAREKTLLRSGHPLARGVVDYKKLGKAKAAYYDAILRLVDPNGVLHPQLKLTRDQSDEGGAGTGRLSCSDPNFQALPHADDDPNAIYQVRDLVVPPPGYEIAKLDYQRAEVWMAGSYCEEPVILAAYAGDVDLYSELGKDHGLTYTQSKILFLMIQYGAGAKKIADTFGWDVRWCTRTERWVGKAADVKRAFLERMPRIKRAIWAYSDAWKERGVLRTWAGRPMHYPGDRPYAGWNRVIQGGVADMIRVAMQRLEPVLAALGARMVLQVHDELVVMYPAERRAQVLSVCREVMTDFPNFKLRPRVDVKTSAVNYARCV